MLVLFFIFVVLSQEGLPELSDPVDARAAGQISLISEADEKPIADELPWLYEFTLTGPSGPSTLSNCQQPSTEDSIRVTSIKWPENATARYLAVIHNPSEASGGVIALRGCEGTQLEIRSVNGIAKPPTEQVVSDKLDSDNMGLRFSIERGREVWEVRDES